MENYRKGELNWNMLQAELKLSALVCALKLIKPLSFTIFYMYSETERKYERM